jgi:hypothetical protein
MWVLVLVVVCLLAVMLWWKWATNASDSVLGETDYSGTIRQFTRCVQDGGRLILEATSQQASLSFTRCSAEDGKGELELRLLGDEVTVEQVEELRRNLDVLRIPFTVDKPEGAQHAHEVVFRFSSDCVEKGDRIVDLALSAAGVRPGGHYSHRFEGEFDAQADTEYLRELNLAARDLAETRLQRSVFDRILKHWK